MINLENQLSHELLGELTNNVLVPGLQNRSLALLTQLYSLIELHLLDVVDHNDFADVVEALVQVLVQVWGQLVHNHLIKLLTFFLLIL